MAIPTASDLSVTNTLPDDDITAFTIGDPEWMMQIAADIYSNREGAVAREYTTNAADEHIKYNVKRPVEVTLPSGMNPFFTVRDYAQGMPKDVFKAVYTKFATSTKRQSAKENGMLGIGCKAAAAYTTQFSVTSINQGRKVVGVISREESNYNISLQIVHDGPSDEPSGVEVRVPIHNIDEFNRKAMDVYRFWTAGTLLVNGDEIVPQMGDQLDDGLYMSTSDKSYVVMGNVGYPINNPSALFSKHGLNQIPFVAFVENGQVHFTPAREALKYTALAISTLESVVSNFATSVKAKAQAEVDNAKNHYEAYLAWTNWTARLGFGVLSDLSYKGDALTYEIKVRAKVYQTRGYGRSVYSVDEWPIDRLKNTIVVTDYTMSLGTPHKVKIKDWVRLKGLSNTYYLFVAGKVNSPWIDPTRTVSWEQVAIDIPNQKGGGNGGVRRIKGTFDYQTINGFETEKAIPVGKDVYYIRVQDYKKWNVTKVLTTLGWTNAAVVVLAANRTVKFARDNPSAKDFIVEAQKMVNMNPTSLIPDHVKPAMAIDYTTERWLSVLDTREIDDLAFAAWPGQGRYKRYSSRALQEGPGPCQTCHLGYTVREYSPKTYTDLTTTYPLLNQMNVNSRSGMLPDIYLYLNAKYNSQKETNMAFPSKVITGTGGVNSVSAYDVSTGQFYMADQNHPHYEAILSGLTAENPAVWDLFDVATGVVNRLQNITDRISWDGANIRFDGDPIHSVLANQLQRAMEQGESNLEALARFWEKLAQNPNEHSREQAYEFLATHDFQITADGDVVGYKGVFQTDEGNFRSWYASTVPGVPAAYVNGEPLESLAYVVAGIGDVVSMPRSEVKHDPSVTCHRGLHVATYDYATSYGDVVTEVHVNPRDIVSVPNFASGQKVRACRYTVARVVNAANTGGPVLKTETPQWQPDVSYAG